MSNDEKDTISRKIDKHHEAIMIRMDDFEKQIEPVVQLYKNAQGFGIIISWVAKYIVTPCIILIGALLTIKKLHE